MQSTVAGLIRAPNESFWLIFQPEIQDEVRDSVAVKSDSKFQVSSSHSPAILLTSL